MIKKLKIFNYHLSEFSKFGDSVSRIAKFYVFLMRIRIQNLDSNSADF